MNCKNCFNLLKKCRLCNENYYLFSSTEENGDYCSVCPSNTYRKTYPPQEKPICNPKTIISGNLSTTADPRSFLFSFDEAWEDYFRNFEANFKIEITGRNLTDYDCKANRNTFLNNSYTINCTYKLNVTKLDNIKITLLNVPPEDEFSERVIRIKDHKVSMKKYVYCFQNYSLNQGKKK